MKLVQVFWSDNLYSETGRVTNPSLMVDSNNKLVLLYRDGNNAFEYENIRFVHLDENYAYYGDNNALRFPEHDNPHYRWEDPKCFTYQGKTMLSGNFIDFSSENVPEGWPYGYSSAIFICELNDWGAVSNYRVIRPPEFPTSIEKNWVFFEQGSRLLCTYQLWNCCHGVREVNLSTGMVNPGYFSYYQDHNWSDRFGIPRTTASVIEHEGLLWGAHHSRRIIPVTHKCFMPLQYNMGFYAFEPIPPFNIVRFSPEPVYGGSKFKLAGFVRQPWTDTVFPSGLVWWNDKLLMAAGIADHTIHLVEFSPAELMEYTQ